MNLTNVMIIFFLLIVFTGVILEVYGGTATLFMSSVFFIMGLMLRRRLAKKEAKSIELINFDELPEEFKCNNRIKEIRESFSKFKFKYYKSFILESTGKFIDIYYFEDLFAEMIVDEEGGVPSIFLYSFFENEFVVISESGPKSEDEINKLKKAELHWFPEISLKEMMKFHQMRVQYLRNEGTAKASLDVLTFSKMISETIEEE